MNNERHVYCAYEIMAWIWRNPGKINAKVWHLFSGLEITAHLTKVNCHVKDLLETENSIASVKYTHMERKNIQLSISTSLLSG